jgi:hypothetical protein
MEAMPKSTRTPITKTESAVQTPITPVEKNFLLGYLNEVAKGGARVREE